MPNYIQVVTTVDNRQEASRIARRLVDEGLAACVQILGPIESVYRWKGSIETADEWQCVIKTEERNWNSVVELIDMIHPYEVPEIISLPILGGSREYLDWLDDQIKHK